MSDDEKKAPASASAVLKAALALVAMSLLTFFASHLWSVAERLEAAHQETRERLQDLESDKAKWATLADLHNKQTETEVQLEVMRQVWTYEYDREVPQPKRRIGPKLPDAPEPVVEDQKPLDPEQYRKMREHQYPNEPSRKK